jgi:hypothetical protein
MVNTNLYLESEVQIEQVLNEVDQASRLVPQGPSGMELICDLTAMESCFHILHCEKKLTRTPYLLTAVVNTVPVVHSVIQVTTVVKKPVIFHIALLHADCITEFFVFFDPKLYFHQHVDYLFSHTKELLGLI